jgi:hypothetical protein
LLFGRRLRRPILSFFNAPGRLGGWISGHRILEISRRLVAEAPWGVVVEVLRHEMAHQFVEEVLGVVDEAAHGACFRAVCAERGIDGNASGMPRPAASEAPILERIRKLLALAESANEHEAQAATRAARRLMLKHNLNEVIRASAEGFGFRQIGRPTGRVSEAEVVISNILSDHFFVDSIWVPVWRVLEGKKGSVLEICGTAENLEIAAYVHAFLMTTAERLWREHKREHRIRVNRDRRAFIAGVMVGFRRQLERQAKADAGEGLVWMGDPELDRYFRRRFPRVHRTRHRSSHGNAAHAQGAEVGERLVLHRGVEAGPSGAPKLLPR